MTLAMQASMKESILTLLSGINNTPEQRKKKMEALDLLFNNSFALIGSKAYDLLAPQMTNLNSKINELEQKIVVVLNEKTPEMQLKNYEDTVKTLISELCANFDAPFVQPLDSLFHPDLLNALDPALKTKIVELFRGIFGPFITLMEKQCDLAEKLSTISAISTEKKQQLEHFFETGFFPLACRFNRSGIYYLLFLKEDFFGRYKQVNDRIKAVIENQFGIKDWRCE